MLNAVKMELYRMFKSRNFYTMGIILAAAVLFTTAMEEVAENTVEREAGEAAYEQEYGQEKLNEAPEDMHVGLSVEAAFKKGENITVDKMLFANIKAKFFALFMVIFAVNFSIADISSGYIKNIGGQISHRWNLVMAKAAALFVYTVFALMFCVIMQALANRIFFGYIAWEDKAVLAGYIMIQICLHFALVMICMMAALFFRSHAGSMIIAVFLCMNVQVIVYGFIDKLIAKAADTGFHIAEHTVTGKIALLPIDMTGRQSMYAVVTAAGFAAAAFLVSSLVFGKRDIV